MNRRQGMLGVLSLLTFVSLASSALADGRVVVERYQPHADARVQVGRVAQARTGKMEREAPARGKMEKASPAPAPASSKQRASTVAPRTMRARR